VIALNLHDVALVDRGPGLRVAFPLHSAVGTASTGAVLIELQPGATLAAHRDSAEETLLVLEGAVEAHVEGEAAPLAAGELAVVPAMAPHGMTNVGDTVALVLGFFSSSTFIATFDAPKPDGMQVFAMGAPVPLAAPLELAVPA
jgi:quercetin dioxygenase-like cupin family protein